MRLLFKFPTRSRPGKFRQTFDKYRRMLSGNHEYEWRITIDVDDRTMNNPSTTSWLRSIPGVKLYIGRNHSKVEAINANMEDINADIISLISDDMVPQVAGYDNIIATRMAEHFPNLDGVLHFNDGRVGEVLNTLSIMGVNLYKEWGYLYHPQYKSLWCLPGDSKIYMANQTMKNIREVEINDEVVGSDELITRGSLRGPRNKLCKSTVTAIHSREAPVIKITLESGAILRCTEDHLWAHYSYCPGFTYNNNYSKPFLGMKMVRVHSQFGVPPIGSEKDMGWLAGIYDGEGSFPVINQSMTKNPDICCEIIRILDKYGFSVINKKATGREKSFNPDGDQRQFYISGGRDEYIRFLDWTRPIKNNTHQLTKRVFTARFGLQDTIIKIEPDGEEKVYCLTTNSGNFVADGYLSHNCDNEFTDVTRAAGKAKYFDQVIIKHAWTDHTGKDRLHVKNESFYQKDQDIYNRRRSAGFPKHNV